MSDTPEIIRRYIDMQQAKERYKDALLNVSEHDLSVISDYLHQSGFFYHHEDDMVVYWQYKRTELTLMLPKYFFADARHIIDALIKNLDAIGCI